MTILSNIRVVRRSLFRLFSENRCRELLEGDLDYNLSQFPFDTFFIDLSYALPVLHFNGPPKRKSTSTSIPRYGRSIYSVADASHFRRQ